jgi:hypothetical protein
VRVHERRHHVERALAVSYRRRPDPARVLRAGACAALRIVELLGPVDRVSWFGLMNARGGTISEERTDLRPLLEVRARVDRQAREEEEGGRDEVERPVHADARWRGFRPPSS